jgi:aryl-alcohol dehydrogenase-like predicted oxidoreductase
MEYRRMGRTGLKVSELCLGTMTFGQSADEAESRRMTDLAIDAGVNFFDCADTYAGGESEVLLGKALAGKRDRVVVASKFFNPTGPGPNDSGMSRVHVMQAIEASLRRMGTDYLDLYYVHHVDDQTPLEEMLRAMDDLVHQGKVRYAACSNYQAWRLMESLWLSEHHGLARFECHQPLYNLVTRDIEQELVPACRLKGLGVVVWSPLAGGFLSGKYRPGERSRQGSRSAEAWAYPSVYFAATADETLQALLEVSAAIGRSAAQTALRWVLEQPAITSAIVGARDAGQLEDNLRAASWRLDAEPLERLSRVSYLPPRYPESMEAGMRARRESAVKMPSLG